MNLVSCQKKLGIFFSPSNKRYQNSFSMVHNDDWVSSKEKCLSRFKWFNSFINDCTYVSLKDKSDVVIIGIEY